MEKSQHFIFDINGILVSSDILTVCFACDYQKCKGICCVEGDSGAPMLEDEETFLEDSYPLYEDLLSPEGKAVLNNQGFATVDGDGDFVTPLIHNRECAYARFDEMGNCLCAVEMGIRSKSGCHASFVKPISCRLYPIRVAQMSNGTLALNLHRWKICKDAFTKGEELGIPVYKFLKEPIIARFGQDFYEALCAAAESLKN